MARALIQEQEAEADRLAGEHAIDQADAAGDGNKLNDETRKNHEDRDPNRCAENDPSSSR